MDIFDTIFEKACDLFNTDDPTSDQTQLAEIILTEEADTHQETAYDRWSDDQLLGSL